MRKYYRIEKKLASTSHSNTKTIEPKSVSRRVLIAAAAVMAVCFMLTLSFPTIRAAAYENLVQLFDKYLTIDFSYRTKAFYKGDIIINYLPKGYVLVDEFRTDAISILSFKNGNDDIITLTYGKNENYIPQYDYENSEIEKIYVDDITVYWIKSNVDDYSFASWNYSTMAFSLKGHINKDIINRFIQNLVVNS